MFKPKRVINIIKIRKNEFYEQPENDIFSLK